MEDAISECSKIEHLQTKSCAGQAVNKSENSVHLIARTDALVAETQTV